MMRVNQKVVGCIRLFCYWKGKIWRKIYRVWYFLGHSTLHQVIKGYVHTNKMDKVVCPCKTCMLTYSHQRSRCFPGIEPTPNCLVDMMYTNSRKQNDVLAAIIIVLLLIIITFIVFEYFWIVFQFKNIFGSLC